jgi:putative DNA primase/helicase
MSLGAKLHNLSQDTKKTPIQPCAGAISPELKKDLAEALLFCNYEDYSSWLTTLMRIKTLGEGGRELAETWSQKSSKHDYIEFADKWNSLEPDRTGYKAIFVEASANGWVNPCKGAKAPRQPFTLMSIPDVLLKPSIGWLVKGLLPSRGLGAIYGASGSGKTFLVLDLLMSICSGQNWFGYKIKKKQTVVYLALEGGAGIKDRLEAYLIHNKIPAPDNFFLIIDQFDVRTESAELIEAILRVNPAIVVIDTLNQSAAGADENSNVDMSLIVSKGQEIANAIDGLTMFIHHSGKDASRGLRGHSSLNASLDIAIEVKSSPLAKSFRITKSKDGTCGSDQGFSLQIIELGIDTDGDAIDSCVVLAEDYSHQVLPKGRNQQIAYGVLSSAVSKLKPEEAKALISEEIKKANPLLKRPDKAAEMAIKKCGFENLLALEIE